MPPRNKPGARAEEAERAICPECGSELDPEGDCPECGYMADEGEKAAGPIANRHAVMSVAIDAETLEQRAAEIATRADGATSAADELLPISISSETPVERFDYYEGEPYHEILDHSARSVDMSRAKDGLPFLDSHNAGEGRAQMGRVMNVRIQNGQLRGDVKFSRRQEAQDLKRDMQDGIKREISVGYRIDRNSIEKTAATDRSLATVRIKNWMPYEASSVAVPADHTVGVGRSADVSAGRRDALLHLARRDLIPAVTGQEEAMAEEKAPASPAVVVGKSADNDAKFREIAALADNHAMQDKLPKWIREGTSPEDARTEIINELQKRIKDGPTFSPVVALTAKEEKTYSFARAIADAADGRDGFEMEVSRSIESKLGNGRPVAQGKGTRLFIPTHLPAYGERAGLDSGTATKGTELKFVQAGSFIEMLRNKARVLQLGATMLSGLDGPVSFPKQVGAGTASWMGENPGSPVTPTDLALGTVTLAAKTLMSSTKFSKQLLRQAVIDVENLVRSDIAAIHALAIDLAAITGSGTSNQPAGILSNTSVGVVALGANGAVPTFAALVQLEAAVENANADTGPRGYLTSPGIKGTLKTTTVFASSLGVPVWLGGLEGEANGYPAYATNQMGANLTKGTATNASAIIYGAWANLLIGEWGALEVLVDPYTLAGYGMLAVTSFQMIDIALRYPESFAVVKDALKGPGF